jgi:hypothetical protein
MNSFFDFAMEILEGEEKQIFLRVFSEKKRQVTSYKDLYKQYRLFLPRSVAKRRGWEHHEELRGEEECLKKKEDEDYEEYKSIRKRLDRLIMEIKK